MGEYDRPPPAFNKQKSTSQNKQNQLKKTTRDNIYIATLNILTLRTDEKLLELETALQNIKWDILGLSEVRRLGNDILEYANFVFCYVGETKGQYGVGFIIRKELKKNILEFTGISERIAVLKINLTGYKDPWTIVQVYAPTEAADEATKDVFYFQLSEVLENTGKNTILMGDFNGKIGTQNTGEELNIGKHGIGIRSRNGERIVSIAQENNLALLNSFFKKNPSRKWTWKSPDGLYCNEIDLIASNQLKYFKDVTVLNQFNFNTNHRMVRATLSLNEPRRRRSHYGHGSYRILTETHNLKTLNQTQETYDREISNMFEDKRAKEKKRDILSLKTKELIQKRKELLTKTKDKETLREITQISKEISKHIRKDKEKGKFDRINYHVARTGGIKKALKELQESKTWVPKIKNNDKKQLTNRKSILETATSFYRDLYSSKMAQDKTTYEDSNDEVIPPILKSEVEHAIKTQKNDKAPGPDNITNETLKISMPDALPKLTSLLNKILETEYIPTQWTTSNIVLIHKKGDKDDMNNYRPISLMSNVYKIFAKIILNRITKKLDEQQPIEQAGFRSGFSTVDHMHTLKQVIEKCQEYGYPLYLAFIDYNKAFDSLEHHHIWLALKNQGIEAKYIRLIQNVYCNSSAQVKLETLGEPFPVRRGVRQGDPLSPKIFTAVLEEVFKKMDWDEFGLNIDGSYLNHLRFADDIVLISHNPETLQFMVQDLAARSEEVGLTMNRSKTKLMTNNVEVPISVEGIKLDYVKSYIYLGQLIAMNDQMQQEIERRIANSWKRFWSLKDIMKSKDYSIAVKRKLFNTCILPILTYGSQTWATTVKTTQKLVSCQRSMERSILGYTRRDKKKATDLRKITKWEDAKSKIKRLKWTWTGHTIRGTIKWAKLLTEWMPRWNTKRKRGRQLKRWSDEIKRSAGPMWIRLAKERDRWKKLEEAFVSEGHADQEEGAT